MNPKTHDPREHIRGIHQILISDKKRIGFLFGAGSSFATGVPAASIPAIESMTKKIIDEVAASSTLYASAVQEIKAETAHAKVAFNIESLLSRIEAKRSVIGNGVLNGLNELEFSALASLIKSKVVAMVSVHKAITRADLGNLAHAKLANWIEKARRRYPAEIYTTNYDYLFEIALEAAGIPYFDGFAGSFKPFFCPEAVEDLEAYSHLVKLWKMHGSLGWTYREEDKAVIRDGTSTSEVLIFPSHLKYDTSKKQPYVGLIDRLCTFLQQDDAVLFVCGYSFGDNHINERIITSLRRGANSHVIALYYDEYNSGGTKFNYALDREDNQLRRMATRETSGKMSVYGIRHAVIGGKFGEWQLRSEPQKDESIRVSQYFDEDAAVPSNEPGERKGDENWAGTGRFLLPDFKSLAEFLSDLSSPNNFHEGPLKP